MDESGVDGGSGALYAPVGEQQGEAVVHTDDRDIWDPRGWVNGDERERDTDKNN